ncbi:hypothetical protein D3C75_1257710 [compost metagenome]
MSFIDDDETAFDLAGANLLASNDSVDVCPSSSSSTLDELMADDALDGEMSIGELSALAEQIQSSAVQQAPIVVTNASPVAHFVAPVVEQQGGGIEFCM